MNAFERRRAESASMTQRGSAVDDVAAAMGEATRVFAGLGRQPPCPDTPRARWSARVIGQIRAALFWLFPQITQSDAAVLDAVGKLANVVREKEGELKQLEERLATLERSDTGPLVAETPIPYGNFKESGTTGMVTRQDVLYAYRLILGREPEDEAAIEFHRDVRSVAALRQRFMEAPEFVPFRAPVYGHPLHGVLRQEIEVDAGAQLKPLLDRVHRIWSRLGQDDPFYSVLTYDQFHKDQIADHMDEFYTSGEKDVERLARSLERNGLGGKVRQVVELGCGVGRLTEQLAGKFPSVIGLDVSNAHLELAKEHCLRRGHKNVDFRQVRSVADLETLPPIDLFFSMIVLQHNPPPVIVALLRQFAAKMAPGGIMYFQVPTHLPGYRFDATEYLRRPETVTIEMHAVPQADIFKLLDENRLRLVEIIEDDCTGIQGAVSNTFVAVRV